jgi:hypothetical protein
MIVIGVLVAGSSRSGFPCVFSVHHSGPPPSFGTTFDPLAFVADLLMYYAIAVALAAWRQQRRSAR